ncbi:quinone oxidoreductase family protein [Bradyrhizobium sp. RDT10]
MKAVFFREHGDLSVLQYDEVPTPDPEPGWVRLKVHACGLNHLDVFSRRGMPGIKVELPGITGGDCAGTVDKLGDGVSGWKVGERVLPIPHHVGWSTGTFEMLGETRNGAMAEYCTVRASQLMRLPEKISDEKAAALPAPMEQPTGCCTPAARSRPAKPCWCWARRAASAPQACFSPNSPAVR